METPVIVLIQHMIFSIKSGSSTAHSLETFKTAHKELWLKLLLSNVELNQIPVSSIEYELKFIIERGLKGLPILNSLLEVNKRALLKLHSQIDLHTAKTPFLALIPLFLLQMPSLILIFIFPLINELLESFN
jgi:hypothetical protein